MALLSSIAVGYSVLKKGAQVAKKLRRRGRSQVASSLAAGGPFTGETGTGVFTSGPSDYVTLDEEDITVMPSGKAAKTRFKVDEEGNVEVDDRRRRRRRRLLTAQDRADIVFIVGTLGKGESAKTAIATLLSRRC